MILGIGTDVVDVERVREILGQWGDRFLRKVFTTLERDEGEVSPDRYDFFAARFAAKEAAIKALRPEKGGFIPIRQIEIKRASDGAPVIAFSGRAAELFAKRNGRRAHVTISHDAGVAVATVILEG